MENFDQREIMKRSDEDDRRLFASLKDPKLERDIISIKHDDPEVNWLDVSCFGHHSDERVWKRLRYILQQNTTLRSFSILGVFHLNATLLVAGIKNNRSVEIIKLSDIYLQGTVTLDTLAPHLSRNPSLQRIEITRCNIGSAGVDIISRALLDRSEHTLEYLGLDDNKIPDIDLDKLVLALSRNKWLRWISLSDNRIGVRGCTSLTGLLQNDQSSLQYLHLDGNVINDESTIILANSLTKNTHLRRLNLARNEEITAAGLLSVLKTVCDYFNSCIADIMNSNHTVHSIDISHSNLTRDWGVDDANLLRASLEMNAEMFFNRNKMLATRHKVIWSHSRGGLNIGASSVDTGTMPRILEWIAGPDKTSLIQHHDSPLPKSRVDSIKLDGLYRIVRSRPDLCGATGRQSIPTDPGACLKELRRDICGATSDEYIPSVMGACQKEITDLWRENDELPSKNSLLGEMAQYSPPKKRQRINNWCG